MNPRSSSPSQSGTQRFGYFMLQVKSESGDAGARLGLVLEDLGTGEKHRLDGGSALLAFLDAWHRRADEGRLPPGEFADVKKTSS